MYFVFRMVDTNYIVIWVHDDTYRIADFLYEVHKICESDPILQIVMLCVLYFCATFCGMISTFATLHFYSYNLICYYINQIL